MLCASALMSKITGYSILLLRGDHENNNEYSTDARSNLDERPREKARE